MRITKPKYIQILNYTFQNLNHMSLRIFLKYLFNLKVSYLKIFE